MPSFGVTSALGRLLPVRPKGSGRPLHSQIRPLRLGFLLFQVERRLLREKQTIEMHLL